MKLLIDECLYTSLVEVAHGAGYVADHVNYLGLGSSKDWQLMATIRAKEYTFVTNNRSDFLSLHGQEPLHAGVIIIVPNVMPARQRELFTAALKHIGARDRRVRWKMTCFFFRTTVKKLFSRLRSEWCGTAMLEPGDSVWRPRERSMYPFVDQRV